MLGRSLRRNFAEMVFFGGLTLAFSVQKKLVSDYYNSGKQNSVLSPAELEAIHSCNICSVAPYYNAAYYAREYKPRTNLSAMVHYCPIQEKSSKIIFQKDSNGFLKPLVDFPLGEKDIPGTAIRSFLYNQYGIKNTYGFNLYSVKSIRQPNGKNQVDLRFKCATHHPSKNDGVIIVDLEQIPEILESFHPRHREHVANYVGSLTCDPCEEVRRNLRGG